MGFDSPSHWAIIAAVAIVLFGYKKLPDMSRSVGRSLRIFKTEMKGLTDDDATRAEDTANAVPVAPVAAPVAPPAAPVAGATSEVVAPAAPAPVTAQPVAPVAMPPAAAPTTQQMGV